MLKLRSSRKHPILPCLSILVSLRALNLLFIHLFVHSVFFADVFSLAQRNPIENHYSDVSQSGKSHSVLHLHSFVDAFKKT